MAALSDYADARHAPGLDLDAIERDYLVQCGPCDYGLVEMGCACPTGEPRWAITVLVAEVRNLRREVRDRSREVVEEKVSRVVAVARARTAGVRLAYATFVVGMIFAWLALVVGGWNG